MTDTFEAKGKRKKLVAEEEGFEILTIWDSEYKNRKDYILEKCLNFLKIIKNYA